MQATKSVIFFAAGGVPTAAELTQIARLQLMYGKVKVRNGAADARYGTHLEPADALAGTVPLTYKTAAGPAIDTALYPDGDVTLTDVTKPDAVMILPGVASVAAAAGTLQLRCVKAELNETTGVVTLSDITSGAESAWSSGTPAKATIDADSGLVTGAAGGAGSTVITVTVTYDTDKTVTATRTVTVT